MNRTFKTVALPILVVFVLVYVAQSMFHFGGSSTPTKKAGWGSLVQVASTKQSAQTLQSVKFNQSNVKVTWILTNGTKFSAGYPRTGDAADRARRRRSSSNGVLGRQHPVLGRGRQRVAQPAAGQRCRSCSSSASGSS